ncbi:hypothetical protein ScPMuIL_016885, partial [Solemya velum]
LSSYFTTISAFSTTNRGRNCGLGPITPTFDHHHHHHHHHHHRQQPLTGCQK